MIVNGRRTFTICLPTSYIGKRRLIYQGSSESSTKEAKVSINKNVYTIWNNKGGVGKTTLTFHIATQYAKTHPTDRVVVIDMCPQANVSSALLGKIFNIHKNLMNWFKVVPVRENLTYLVT